MCPQSSPLRLVLDTNVVLDLVYWHDAAVAPIARQLSSAEAIALTDARCFAELQQVLALDRFALSAERQCELAESYRSACVWHATPGAPARPLPRCKDGDDQKFLELAFSAQAGLLVTKDRALLKLARRMQTLCATRIVTPQQAVALIQPAPAQ